MNDLVPDVLEVLDSRVVGTRMPPEGGVINVVQHQVRGFDGQHYVCFSQSEYHGGHKFSTGYYGFTAIDATPTPDIEAILEDTQPMKAVQS